MHKCPKCGTEYEGRFCPECGEQWLEEKICPECGAKLNGSVKFCNHCGYSFTEQTERHEKATSCAPSKSRQKLSKAWGWVKTHKEKVVAIALVLVALIVLLSLIPMFIAMKTNGTYYSYSNGEYDKKSYITLRFGTWKDDDGESGSYKIEGDNITIYVDFFGEQMEYATGTVSNGVLKLDNVGVFCQENHRHNYGEWEVTTAVTCTTDGTETHECLCGVKETQTIKALGHDFVYQSDGNATCTKAGTQSGKCTRCEKTDVKSEAALGHDLHNDICARCGDNALQLVLSSDGSYYSVTKYYQNDPKTVNIPQTYNGLPVTEIGKYAFSACSSLTRVNIPDGVTSIGYEAFGGCSGLTSLTIPDGVTEIGDSAFSGCSSLTSITIPNSVTTIGEYAFSGCSGLTSITIGNGVTAIDNWAFYGCAGLKDINFNGTKQQWRAIKINSNSYWGTGDYTIHCTDGDLSK